MDTDAEGRMPDPPRVDLWALPKIVELRAVRVRYRQPRQHIVRGQVVDAPEAVEFLVRTDGEIPVRIVGGAKTIRVERPRGAPVQLRVRGGASQIELDGTSLGAKGGDTTVDSRGWTGSGDRYALDVIGGAKTITVVERPD